MSNSNMIKMVVHEDSWIDNERDHLTLLIPLKQMISLMAVTMKNIASGDDNNPARLYASNVYTSLNLLDNVLDGEENDLSIKELSYRPAGRKNGRSPVLEKTIIDFMKNCDKWSGTHTQLLRTLKKTVPAKTHKFEEWPKSSNSLSYRLRQSEAHLLKRGIEISRIKRSDERVITLEKIK